MNCGLIMLANASFAANSGGGGHSVATVSQHDGNGFTAPVKVVVHGSLLSSIIC